MCPKYIPHQMRYQGFKDNLISEPTTLHILSNFLYETQILKQEVSS